jgi:hypothetical protein
MVHATLLGRLLSWPCASVSGLGLHLQTHNHVTPDQSVTAACCCACLQLPQPGLFAASALGHCVLGLVLQQHLDLSTLGCSSSVLHRDTHYAAVPIAAAAAAAGGLRLAL